MGDSLLILGHHYQQDEVIRFADLRGDSYRLSQLAAQSRACRAIVFCGVHFMAETADILSRDEVEVYLPDLAAGCSMADMADLESVEAAWEDLGEVIDTDDLMPVTYINSSADLKAFCGRQRRHRLHQLQCPRRPGLVVPPAQPRALLPRPAPGPQHRPGMGVPLEQMIVWDPREPLGGNDPEAIAASRVLLWKGHCSVHQMFKPDHVTQFRRRFPGGKILVHPECMMQVVDSADLVGSTEFIIKTIERAPAGSTWGIGTELHLVNRLAAGTPRQAHPFLVSHGLHVRHHVPDRPAPPGLVPRKPGSQARRQPDQGSRRDGPLGAHRAERMLEVK